MDNYFELEKKANQLRKITLEMCIKAGTGHVTSSMSCAEILTSLYYGNILTYDPKNRYWKERDRFILSKGQASPMLYTILADCGFYPQEDLWKFAKGEDGSGKNAPFGVHLQCTVPGVEFTTGSLGHGLGYAAGIAEVAKMDKRDYHVCVLLGDGELYEGSNWEVAFYASHHQLDKLIAIVDRNNMCTNGYTEKIVSLEPLKEKWISSGWNVQEVDGHSIKELVNVLEDMKYNKNGSPSCVIAHTIKGRGIASMIDKLYLHGVAPQGKEARTAQEDLDHFILEHTTRGHT